MMIGVPRDQHAVGAMRQAAEGGVIGERGACAYGAQQRGLPIDDRAAYAGLTVVSDLMSATDRFVSFN